MASELQLRDGLYGFEYREEDQRRVSPEERKTYDIKAFWLRHHEITRLAAEGFKQTEIAEILHIHPQTVSNTLNSQIGKEKTAELTELRDGETKKRLAQIRILTEKALDTFHEIFDDDTGQVTLKDKKEVANTVLLELSGLRVPTRIQSQSRVTVLSSEELKDFKARGIAAMKEAGLVVDVEPTQIEEVSDATKTLPTE